MDEELHNLPPPSFDATEEPAPKEPRKGIRPQSSKAKGRRLQQWAASQYKEAFPHLQGNDVRSLSMGAAGDDLILSPAALEVLPYNFEMKNVEKFQLWSTLRQVGKRHTECEDDTVPCVVAKKNRAQPVTIVPLGHLIHLLQCTVTPVGQDGAIPEASVDTMVAVGEEVSLDDALYSALSGVSSAVSSSNGIISMLHYHFFVQAKSKFNFWNYWGDLWSRYKSSDACPVVVFNRGDSRAVVYAMMPFFAHVDLLKARWAHVRKRKILALMAET